MGFFTRAHNFIIDGPDGQEQSPPIDPHEVLRQANKRLEEALATHKQSSSLVISNETMDLTRGGGGQQFNIRSGSSSFSGNIRPLDEKEMLKLDAELANMKARLDARQTSKARKAAGITGRGGRGGVNGIAEGPTTNGNRIGSSMPSNNSVTNGITYAATSSSTAPTLPPSLNSQLPPNFAGFPPPPPGFPMTELLPGSIPLNFMNFPPPPGAVPPQFMTQGKEGMPNYFPIPPGYMPPLPQGVAPPMGFPPFHLMPFMPTGAGMNFAPPSIPSVDSQSTSNETETTVEEDEEAEENHQPVKTPALSPTLLR